MTRETKPPLGVTPEWLWREVRITRLVEAIHRFDNHPMTGNDNIRRNKLIAIWGDEIQRHVAFAMKRYGKRR